MDRRYRNAFDQIHMSAACQARILAAASSASQQEDQSAMKKPKNVLKTMLLAAALAGCLSAVAYASSNMLPAQLNQLSNVVLSNSDDKTSVKTTKDGSKLYVIEQDNGTREEITVNEKALKDEHLKLSREQGEEVCLVISDDNAGNTNSSSKQTSGTSSSKAQVKTENKSATRK